MYVRLGLANPKEGMTEDALNYFRDIYHLNLKKVKNFIRS